MAAYNSSSAYDFDLFEQSSAAPQLEPKRRPSQPQQQKKRPRPAQKTAQQRKAEAALARRTAIVRAAVILVFAVIVGLSVNSRSRLNELHGDIVKAQNSLSELQSEHTRLTMMLNSKVSLEKVEEYAVYTLGMVKRDRYQIVYFDLSEGNRVVTPAN